MPGVADSKGPEHNLSSFAKAGDPVRRGFSVQSLLPLEGWIARSRLRRGFAGPRAHSAALALAKAASRATTIVVWRETQVLDLATGFRPSFANSLSLSVRKGRRESRALTAPAAPCAMRNENAHGLDRYSRDIPAFPAQWFYGFLRALPGERRFLSPLSAGYLPQNRRHGRGARTTRLRRTPLAFSPGSELPDASCVHRISRPTFRDDRDPSPCWRGVS